MCALGKLQTHIEKAIHRNSALLVYDHCLSMSGPGDQATKNASPSTTWLYSENYDVSLSVPHRLSRERFNTMEFYFFGGKEFERLYNCSSYDVGDVPVENRLHPVVGWTLLLLFAIFEVIVVKIMLSRPALRMPQNSHIYVSV